MEGDVLRVVGGTLEVSEGDGLSETRRGGAMEGKARPPD